MPTAQDRFAELMRGHLAPAIRQLGLKGSGHEYLLPDARSWVLVGFQRSLFDDRSHLRFTVNLTVANKGTWEEMRAETRDWRQPFGERPAPNTRYGPRIWQERIGRLMPVKEDKWWELTPQSDLETLASDVTAAIRDFGLPAIRSQLEKGDGMDAPA